MSKLPCRRHGSRLIFVNLEMTNTLTPYFEDADNIATLNHVEVSLFGSVVNPNISSRPCIWVHSLHCAVGTKETDSSRR
jgi:hypothetical protein